MTTLSEPSPGLAIRALREVDFAERLTGVTLNQMAGTIPHDLYTLEAAVNFLRIDPVELLLAPGGRAAVHYVSPTALATWVEEVLEDVELAEAIRTEAAREEFYAQQIGPVRALLQERLGQLRRAAGEEQAVREKGAQA